jgi:hypothetical protein
MSVRIYRATVRGFFADLAAGTRELLLAEADEHDALRAAFTEDGTFTYEPDLVAFSFRFQLREPDEDVSPDTSRELAADRAIALAVSFLERHGIGHRRLRVQATDMADAWRD